MEYVIKDLKRSLATTVELQDRHFIAEGGEGRVYGRDNLIYKIYFKPDKMIPLAKIDELSTLDSPNIIRPLQVVFDKKNVAVGFTMKWEKDNVALCKLFTNDFWNRFNITPDLVVKLVKQIVYNIKYIHSKNCLIVDGNEMNYLVNDQDFSTPYFIDVDSYQTPHFPATAIMPSIRDHHSKGFSELTDWFSFAIIATQLFVGIHPFKGSHPKYKRTELEKRMRDNVSIFNKNVSIPSAARDFNCIPVTYKDWFIRMFEKGERLDPPDIEGKISMFVKAKVVQSSGAFILVLFKDYKNSTARPDIELDTKVIGAHIAYTSLTNTPIRVDVASRKLVFHNFKGEEIPSNLACTHKTIINGKLVVLNGDKLMEVSLEEFQGKGFNAPNIVPVVKTFWNVLPNATKLFDGLAYQDVLGKAYFVIPYVGDTSRTSCMIQQIKELEGYRVLEGKHDSNVVMIIAFKDNKYDRFIFKISEDYRMYECIKFEDVEYHIPNFVTLDNGIVVSINPDDEVEIFSKKLGKPDIKIIKDPAVDFDMKLLKRGVDVYVMKGSELYKMSMK